MTESKTRTGMMGLLVIVIMAYLAGTMTELVSGSSSDPAPAVYLPVDQGAQVIDPSSPRDLTVRSGDNVIFLKWRIPESGVYGDHCYIIQKSVEGSVWKNLTSVEGGKTSYSDRWVANGHKTDYRIVSVRDGIWSPPSNVAGAIPIGAPFPPSFLETEVVGSKVVVTIHPPLYDGGSPIIGYALYRKSDLIPKFMEIVRLNATETQYEDLYAMGNATVAYYAVTINSAGMSEASVISVAEDVPSGEVEKGDASKWIRSVSAMILPIAGVTSVILFIIAIYYLLRLRRNVQAMPLYDPRALIYPRGA
jgi:hypothetical protein